MKAKDTVMNSEQIVKATWINPNYPKDSPVERLSTPQEVGIAQAQAEISFKAGIKEVVEFVEAEGVMCQYLDMLNRWQAKLKEWNI